MFSFSFGGYEALWVLAIIFWEIAILYVLIAYFLGLGSVKAVAKCGDEKLIGRSERCLKWFRIWWILFGLAILANIMFSREIIYGPVTLQLLVTAILCQLPTPFINAYFAVRLFMMKKISLGIINTLSFIFTGVTSCLAMGICLFGEY